MEQPSTPLLPVEIINTALVVFGGLLGSIVTGLMSVYFGRQKQTAESNESNANASQSIAAAADVTTNAAMRAVEMLEKRFNDEAEATQIKIIHLQNESARWEKAYNDLNAKWEKSYSDLKRDYLNLKIEFDALQKDYERVKGLKGGMLG